ncbi:unnamed protein product, partial [Sphacelaria rigidula]
MTNCERIKTTIRNCQLCFAGDLVRQKDTRLSQRVMNGRLSTRGPKEFGRPLKQWEDTLKENLRALGAVNDAYDWVTAAKYLSEWHIEVEKGAEAFEDTWRRADKRESDRRHKREAAASRAAN